MPKVSVIVPVYKAERTLSRCVDSILAQTYTDFEVLLIDDGSPDKSGILCDEYASKDSRVRVFHKPNGGVSSARNLGLDNARGEWIAFVDADDLITKDFLFTAMSHPGDLKILQEITFGTEDFVLPLENPQKLTYIFANDLNEVCRFVEKDYWNYLHTTIWGKVINRKLFIGLRFDENMIVGEDSLIMLYIFNRASSLTVIPGIYYIYLKLSNIESKYRLSINDSFDYLFRYHQLHTNAHFHIDNLEKCLFLTFTRCAKKSIYLAPYSFISHKGYKEYVKEVFNAKIPTIYLFNHYLKLIRETITLRLKFLWKIISKSV